MLDGRYEVFACKGKGVFSTVLRARDKLRLLPNPLTGAEEFAEVAIKVRVTTRMMMCMCSYCTAGIRHARAAAVDTLSTPGTVKNMAVPPYCSSSSPKVGPVVHSHCQVLVPFNGMRSLQWS